MGQYNADSGQSTCSQCPLTNFSNALYAGSGATHCVVDCGKADDRTKNGTCGTTCPAGYIENGPYDCTPCPAGTYLPIAVDHGASPSGVHFPLKECESDVDWSGCATGLVPDQRESKRYVGCRGYEVIASGHDYCMPAPDLNENQYPKNVCRPCAPGKVSGEGARYCADACPIGYVQVGNTCIPNE